MPELTCPACHRKTWSSKWARCFACGADAVPLPSPSADCRGWHVLGQACAICGHITLPARFAEDVQGWVSYMDEKGLTIPPETERELVRRGIRGVTKLLPAPAQERDKTPTERDETQDIVTRDETPEENNVTPPKTGRPGSGLSHAERQRLYRERHKDTS